MLRFVAATVVCCSLAVIPCSAQAEELPPIPPIKRLLPPPGIEIPDEVRKEFEGRLKELTPRIEKLTDEHHRPDVEVFTKAVAFALRFGEFYDKKDFDKARWALKQAEERLALAEKNEFPWLRQTGLVVRGYRSDIDGSVQPYGLVIPDKHDFAKPCPLYVFLHGRGDKETDLHFLYGRARSKGEIVPEGAIVVHPFGRDCIGFKSAGEKDVLHVSYSVESQYMTETPVLVGFSMGGAGAWHIGAHYPYAWLAISPGAGFVDVARYQKIKPEKYPPIYEQKLWGVYDVPAYTRNLFNVPVIAYSGAIDPQKQAADIMAEAFNNEGRELPHLVGPDTAHKYHPETKLKLLARLEHLVAEHQAEAKRPFTLAPESHLQTRTLRYHFGNWLSAWGLEQHWEDARLDGKVEEGRFEINTKNVTRFQVLTIGSTKPRTFVIDGKPVAAKEERFEHAHFERRDGVWHWAPSFGLNRAQYDLCKWPGLQGPIDDAFLEPFLVVLPSGKAAHPGVQQWIDFEWAHLQERWSALFRGSLRVKQDTEVTAEDQKEYHLVCFGDAESNRVLAQSLPKLPLQWNKDKLQFAGKDYDAATHVPLMIYPNPTAPTKYIVLNSGPTFREAHDRTNSLQNPKLPDWAIIDITTPPDAEKPGKVVAADFFDEAWKTKQ